MIVVRKLVSSCGWKCDLGNPSIILKMKILRSELHVQTPGKVFSVDTFV
jgi:hypothetical protein